MVGARSLIPLSCALGFLAGFLVAFSSIGSWGGASVEHAFLQLPDSETSAKALSASSSPTSPELPAGAVAPSPCAEGSSAASSPDEFAPFKVPSEVANGRLFSMWPEDPEEPQVFEPTKPGACLKFLHNPKTGGSTIEDLYKKAKPKPDPRVLGWGRFGDGGLSRKEVVMLPGHNWCYAWHTPPKAAPDLWEDAYSMCDTFCVVRHPLDRAVSEWQYYNMERGCDPAHFEAWSPERLAPVLKGNPFFGSCHWLPQHMFVFHYRKDGVPERVCDHVLRFERLRDDFNELMQAYNYSLRMDSSRKNTRKACDFKISRKLHEMVRQAYAEDYGLFGYK